MSAFSRNLILIGAILSFQPLAKIFISYLGTNGREQTERQKLNALAPPSSSLFIPPSNRTEIIVEKSTPSAKILSSIPVPARIGRRGSLINDLIERPTSLDRRNPWCRRSKMAMATIFGQRIIDGCTILSPGIDNTTGGTPCGDKPRGRTLWWYHQQGLCVSSRWSLLAGLRFSPYLIRARCVSFLMNIASSCDDANMVNMTTRTPCPDERRQ